jgi:hypothetical protein
MIRARLPATVALLVALFPTTAVPARADDAPPLAAPPVDSGPLADDEIAALCRQLDASDFSARERATKRLAAGGTAVIDKVSAAAETDNLEVAMRCLIILKELCQRPDEPGQETAQAALQRLSLSRHRSTARRAAEFLNPPDPVAVSAARRMLLRRVNARAGGMGVRVVQAGIVIGANGGGANVHITNDKGNVQVNAVEGGRRVVITHRQEENIVVCVTESTPAGDKTVVYPAKNPGELKEKYPDAHQLFERYCGGLRRTVNGAR